MKNNLFISRKLNTPSRNDITYLSYCRYDGVLWTDRFCYQSASQGRSPIRISTIEIVEKIINLDYKKILSPYLALGMDIRKFPNYKYGINPEHPMVSYSVLDKCPIDDFYTDVYAYLHSWIKREYSIS